MSDENSQNLQATTAQAATEPAAPAKRPLEMLAELLAAEKKAEAEPEPEPQGKPKPKAVPKDFATLAQALGVDVAKLYDIQIPSAQPDAEPYTIGKLKDLAKAQDDFSIRSLQLEEDARKTRAQLRRSEQELLEIFASLPKDAIKPETRAALQAKRERVLTAERQRVLEVIPEWADADVRTQELESMIEHLKDYGFSADYLTEVFDHRTLRYIRANMQRETQIRKALEKVAERKPTTPPKASKPATPANRSKPNGLREPAGQRVDNFISTIQRFTQ